MLRRAWLRKTGGGMMEGWKGGRMGWKIGVIRLHRISARQVEWWGNETRMLLGQGKANIERKISLEKFVNGTTDWRWPLRALPFRAVEPVTSSLRFRGRRISAPPYPSGFFRRLRSTA